VSVWDKTQRTDDTLSSSDFQWDEQRNEYRCPQGHALRSEWRPFKNPRTHITKANTIIYTSRQSDCASCPMKACCCPNTPIRKIRRSIHEPARNVARAVAKIRLYKQSRKDRKKVEMLFAHLKRIIKLDRLRLRGPSGAHDEFLLAATAQNLRRMAKRLCPSPPRPAFGTAWTLNCQEKTEKTAIRVDNNEKSSNPKRSFMKPSLERLHKNRVFQQHRPKAGSDVAEMAAP
jgi:Transposase DDE domain